MGVDIHPMAVVEEGAQFGVGVSVEAFAILVNWRKLETIQSLGITHQLRVM